MHSIQTARGRRFLTVILAPVAALAGWAVIRLADIELEGSFGDDPASTIGAGSVIVSSLAAALLAWALAALLERWVGRPRTWWAAIASISLALSLFGPGSFTDGSALASLVVLHFLVALVIIVGMLPTVPNCRTNRRSTPRREHQIA